MHNLKASPLSFQRNKNVDKKWGKEGTQIRRFWILKKIEFKFFYFSDIS